VAVWIEWLEWMILAYRGAERPAIDIRTDERHRCLAAAAELQDVDSSQEIRLVEGAGVSPTVRYVASAC